MKSNEVEKVRPVIFLVDDDIDYLEQLKIQVESLGHTAVIANGQKEAERMLEAFVPDLVIYDLMMENKDSGFILAYKTKKRYPDVPVIIATAASAETGIVFSLEKEADKQWIRADKYLEKGLRTDQLQREINKLLFSK
ncbi:MAG: response regulator [Bacteroidales bacterium]|nr:response regulator [Bacteroidales bacterium]